MTRVYIENLKFHHNPSQHLESLFVLRLYLFTSVVVLVVLCFGVQFLCCLHIMYVFIFLFMFELPPIGKQLLTPLTICSLSIKYLIVNLVFPTCFLEWEVLSDCAIS